MPLYFLNQEKCQIGTCPVRFLSFCLFVLNCAMKLKDANYKNHWNILVFYGQWKMTSDLNVSHGKMLDFVAFNCLDSLYSWNSEISILKVIEENMASDLNMSHGKMYDLVAFLSFGLTLVIKLRNFNFESHWNTFLIKKNNFGNKLRNTDFKLKGAL